MKSTQKHKKTNKTKKQKNKNKNKNKNKTKQNKIKQKQKCKKVGRKPERAIYVKGEPKEREREKIQKVD